MSRKVEEKIKCSQCGKAGTMQVWSSINSTIDPEVAQKIVDGSLFTYVCPKCKAKTQVFYGCLYHDMDKQFMIQLVPGEEAAEEAAEAFNKLKKQKMFREIDEDGYVFRIVISQNELQEKVRIINDELDDRAVEVSKYIALMRLAAQGKVSVDSEAYYYELKEGNLAVLVFTEAGSFELTIPRSMYDQVLATLGEPAAGNALYSVNSQWAQKVVEED